MIRSWLLSSSPMGVYAARPLAAVRTDYLRASGLLGTDIDLPRIRLRL
jgi:hypothetical protein